MEKRIDPVNLILYVLRRWRTFIFVGVIGLILGAGFYVVQTKTAPREEEKEIIFEEQYEVDDDLAQSMNLAYQYRKLYEAQKEYNTNSPLMQLDNEKSYEGNVKYYILGGDNTGLLRECYKNILNDEKLLKKIKQTGKYNCNIRYIKDILDVQVYDDSDSMIAAGGENLAEIFGGVKAAVVSLKVFVPAQENGEKLLEVLCEKMDVFSEELKTQYGDFQCIKISEDIYPTNGSDVLDKQKSNVDVMNTYFNAFSKLEDSFEGDDLKYYQTEYLNKVDLQQELPEENVGKINDNNRVSAKSTVKWMILGFFVLMVLASGYFVLCYVLDIHINTAEEVEDSFPIKVLGKVEMKKDSMEKGIDRLIRMLEIKKRGIGDTVEYLSVSLKSLEAEKIILCGDLENPDIRSIAVCLNKLNQKTALGTRIYENSETLEQAKMADGIILLVRIGVSNVMEIKKTLAICEIQNICVLGCIVLE